MSATQVSPQRRRRILHAHQLRQTGATTRSIAQVLNVAPSTIHDDLRLLEQHWQDIAQQAAADALLTALGALQISLNSFFHPQPNRANPFTANQRELILVCRELRQTVNQIHKLQPEDSPEEPPDYPDDQLADAEPHRTPSDTVGQNRTQPNTTEQDRTQSNVAEPPSPDSEPPLSPELFAEALEFIAKHHRLESDPPPSPPNRAARRAQQRRQRKKSPQPATSR